MSEDLRNILIGTSALGAAAVVALWLTATRRGFRSDPASRDRVSNLVMICISLQCLHFTEEFITRFNEQFPKLFGLPAWSSEFFVTFNLLWIFVWVLSAIGIRYNFRPAFFPVWFLIIAMVLNGFAHPVLAIIAEGYFPGLWTASLAGVAGVILGWNFWKFTA